MILNLKKLTVVLYLLILMVGVHASPTIYPFDDAVVVTVQSDESSTKLILDVTNLNPFFYVLKIKASRKYDDFTLADFVYQLAPHEKRNIVFPLSEKYTSVSDIRLQLVWDIGPAKDAKSLYALPIGGLIPVVVCQSSDGPIRTHQKMERAIDLCAPMGAPVIAARGGVVIKVVNSYSQGGMDERHFNFGNRVDVAHEDGTVAMYAHLAPDSAQVSVGQVVKTGDVLGAVGMTGMTSRSHLHFAVYYKDDLFNTVYISPKFISASGDALPGSYMSVLNRKVVVSSGLLNRQRYELDYLVNKVIRGDFYRSEMGWANALFFKGEYLDALHVLTVRLNKNPLDGRANTLMGKIFLHISRPKEAIDSFKNAISNGWDGVDTYLGLADSLDSNGQTLEAIQAYLKALNLAPNSIDIAKKVANQYLKMGLRKQAIDFLKNFDEKLKAAGKQSFFEDDIRALSIQ